MRTRLIFLVALGNGYLEPKASQITYIEEEAEGKLIVNVGCFTDTQ